MNTKLADIIFGRFPKLKRKYDLVVTLVDKVPNYSIIVSLVKRSGYSIVVGLTEMIKPTYNIVVNLVERQNIVYDIVVNLQTLQAYVPTPRDIIVSLQEATEPTYSIVVTLVEGGTDSGCIQLDC